MCTCNTYSVLVIFHQSTQKLGTVNKLYIIFNCCRHFGVIHLNCRCMYNEVSSDDVFCIVTFVNNSTLSFKLICNIRLCTVTARNLISVRNSNMSETAHADSTNTDKMYMCIFLKVIYIKTLHNFILPKSKT